MNIHHVLRGRWRRDCAPYISAVSRAKILEPRQSDGDLRPQASRTKEKRGRTVRWYNAKSSVADEEWNRERVSSGLRRCLVIAARSVRSEIDTTMMIYCQAALYCHPHARREQSEDWDAAVAAEYGMALTFECIDLIYATSRRYKIMAGNLDRTSKWSEACVSGCMHAGGKSLSRRQGICPKAVVEFTIISVVNAVSAKTTMQYILYSSYAHTELLRARLACPAMLRKLCSNNRHSRAVGTASVSLCFWTCLQLQKSLLRIKCPWGKWPHSAYELWATWTIADMYRDGCFWSSTAFYVHKNGCLLSWRKSLHSVKTHDCCFINAGSLKLMRLKRKIMNTNNYVKTENS